jgi:hypothetical protein
MKAARLACRTVHFARRRDNGILHVMRIARAETLSGGLLPHAVRACVLA